jgi:NAD(P)-dependent dehydrogenase (short-subunit alcohol dehydrogenase family)
VTDSDSLDKAIGAVADRHGRLDGCVAAAGIQKLCPSLEYPMDDAKEMLDVNLLGVMRTATLCAKYIYKTHPQKDGPTPSIVAIASMSGLIANKGLICPVYNASKAGVTQLTRNLAMEWGRPGNGNPGGPGGVRIRVNSLSPGNILTPMVLKNFEEVPGLKEKWEEANMMGRLSTPEEFRGAAVFLLSKASSFMTGSNLVVDGGYTAW